MAVKKLTAAEAKWVQQLQELMAQCPSKRFGAYTIGDAEIRLYDKPTFDAYQKANPRDGRDDILIHHEIGTVLATIDTPFQVDGVAS